MKSLSALVSWLPKRMLPGTTPNWVVRTPANPSLRAIQGGSWSTAPPRDTLGPMRGSTRLYDRVKSVAEVVPEDSSVWLCPVVMDPLNASGSRRPRSSVVVPRTVRRTAKLYCVRLLDGWRRLSMSEARMSVPPIRIGSADVKVWLTEKGTASPSDAGRKRSTRRLVPRTSAPVVR